MRLLPLVVVIFVFQFPVPAGLVLYWMTTNLWTCGQQLVMRHRIGLHLADPRGGRASSAESDRTRRRLADARATRPSGVGRRAPSEDADDRRPTQPARRTPRRRRRGRARRTERGRPRRRTDGPGARGRPRGRAEAPEPAERPRGRRGARTPTTRRAGARAAEPEPRRRSRAAGGANGARATAAPAGGGHAASAAARRAPPRARGPRPAAPLQEEGAEPEVTRGGAVRCTAVGPGRARRWARRWTPWSRAWASRRGVVVARGRRGSDIEVDGRGRRHLGAGRARRRDDRRAPVPARFRSSAAPRAAPRRRVALDADGYRARREAALERAGRAGRRGGGRARRRDRARRDDAARPAHRPHGPEGPPRRGHPERGRRAPPADHRRAGRVARTAPAGFT